MKGLYNECNWDSLALRRYNQKLKFMYKATHGMVLSYIVDLILHLVGETSCYDLRNRSDISVLPQRTTIVQTLLFHRLLEHGIALTISIVIVKHTDLFATN